MGNAPPGLFEALEDPRFTRRGEIACRAGRGFKTVKSPLALRPCSQSESRLAPFHNPVITGC
jgi:hypothetical protein